MSAILTKIAAVDERLGILRSGWIDCVEVKKPSWMTKIDAALDERLVLMKERDKPTTTKP